MIRFFIEIAYQGTHYHGWQRQPNVPSVQQTIEEALSKMLGSRLIVIGCGRTDAGVHAKSFFAHFDLKIVANNTQGMDTDCINITAFFGFDPIHRLNKMLPPDISIKQMIHVPKEVHAQYSAKSRTYEYYFHTLKDSFLAPSSALYDANELDIEHMQQGLDLILAQTDYQLFCKSPNQYKHTFCDIKSYAFDRIAETQYKITIQSDRFLQSMIRLIMARVIDIGEHKIGINELKEHLEGNIPLERKYMAYPQGLYLTEVEYDHFKTTFK